MNKKKILDHFSKVDPIIHKVMQDLDFDKWLGDRDQSDYFKSLCREIVYQQLSGKAASTIWGRFEDLVGGVTPQTVLKHSDQQFRDVGLSWAKARYVHDLAEKVKSKEVTLNDLHAQDNESVIQELMLVKGIGRWTAEMFLMFTLDREDVFSYGDLGLKKGLQKLYDIEELSEDNISQIVDPWSPYKTYGSITLWNVLDKA